MRISLDIYLNYFPKKDIIAAEIGVYKGDNAREILKNSEIKELYLIDSFNANSKWFTDSFGKCFTSDTAEIWAKSVIESFRDYGERVRFLHLTSFLASQRFPNEFFDYVYIDGGHDYENVKKDLHAWYPKVKKGGMLAGHDIHVNDVTIAVTEFSVLNKIHVCCFYSLRPSELPLNMELNDFMDWFLIKEK